jgi:signal transduction histidine kinase
VVSAGVTPLRDEQGAIGMAVLTFEDITPRKQVEEELRQAQDALEARVQERTRELEAANAALQTEVLQRREAEAARQEALRQLVEIEEGERRRISRELHDRLGQQITALLLGLETLKASSHGRAQALERIEQLQGIMETMAREVHQFALDLRPTTLDDLGLVAALGNVAEEWSRRVGIEVAYHTRGMETTRLPAEVETMIYRVVLEALTNVLKHADASRVSLILERQNDHAVAIVEDSGRGFDVDAWLQSAEASRRLGLLGMQERVAIVGGTLTVESSPGGGTTIFVRIPLSPRE